MPMEFCYPGCASNGRDLRRLVRNCVPQWHDQILGLAFIQTPHPSWRVVFWLKKKPWFENDVLPNLRSCVERLI
jgi:uracil-DNA glycosylase